jgi:trk system potassium uptake protein TrkH
VVARLYTDFMTALRYASFNTVSIATTTGFHNTDFNLWPAFAPMWMLFYAVSYRVRARPAAA